jgi:hypothetical protein
MFRWYRSFRVRKEEKGPPTEDEIRAWILATFLEAVKDPDGILFFMFDETAMTVSAGMSMHCRPDRIDRDFGAIRIASRDAFQETFRNCAAPYEQTPFAESDSMILAWMFRGPRFRPDGISVCFHPTDWIDRMRRAWPAGSSDHDCEAGVCTSGDFC